MVVFHNPTPIITIKYVLMSDRNCQLPGTHLTLLDLLTNASLKWGQESFVIDKTFRVVAREDRWEMA